MKKIIQISDELFWGFHSIVEIDDYSSFEELAVFMKNELISFLTYHNLLNLVIHAEKLNLHNHNYSNYKDLYDSNDDIVYLCGHC
jgi:hypothetical protein